MNFWKKTLPLSIAFILGWIGILGDYIPHQTSEELTKSIMKGLIIVFAIVAFLGLYSLLQMHWSKIKRKNVGWGYSLLVYIGFFVMLFFGLYNQGEFFWNTQVERGQIQWLYQYAFTPCQATMFSILAFFIASAAYRTFRAKSIEAGILLLAAVLVMFGVVPISGMIWKGFPEIAQWLLEYPNMAVKRAIFFGIALGAISTSLRIIFGIERSYMGGGE
ncbi:MAG: hypothetical protein KAQ98_05320 [Bacteriovoracaceae bacterium]|nr:hypothetical protein [Bacteriovoracaceae bacterium]